MKILKFKKTSKDKYKLFLNNNEVITLYEDVIINNDLFDKSLGQNINLSKSIICKKCNKSYCSKCYLLHKDIITNVKLKPTIIKTKGKPRQNNIFQLQHIQMKQ